MLVRFNPKADIEFHEAIAWYASKARGLDYEFMRCVDEVLSRIKNNPLMFDVLA